MFLFFPLPRLTFFLFVDTRVKWGSRLPPNRPRRLQVIRIYELYSETGRRVLWISPNESCPRTEQPPACSKIFYSHRFVCFWQNRPSPVPKMEQRLDAKYAFSRPGTSCRPLAVLPPPESRLRIIRPGPAARPHTACTAVLVTAGEHTSQSKRYAVALWDFAPRSVILLQSGHVGSIARHTFSI